MSRNAFNDAGSRHLEALKIAKANFQAINVDYDAAALNAAAATILIDYSKHGDRGSGGVSSSPPAPDSAVPNCPACGGPCYDNRKTKKNPKGPDFKCKDTGCAKAGWLKGGVLSWSE